MIDLDEDRELLAAPHRLELLPDRSPHWPAWEIQYTDIQSRAVPVAGPADIRVVERGSVRVSVEVRRSFGHSVVRQVYRLSAGSEANRLEVLCEIGWAETATLLKAAFPLSTGCTEATYDLGLGVIRRGINTKEAYEVPAQQWADVTTRDGTYGVAILSDAKIGWDKPNDHLLRLSLARSPGVGKRFSHQATQDHGLHRFGYAVVGHRGDWAEGDVPRAAARFNQPLRAVAVPRHDGDMGRWWSMADVGGRRDVSIAALKRAEDGDGVVLRIQEQLGRRTEVVPRVEGHVGPMTHLDGRERQTGARSAPVPLPLAPFELATLGFSGPEKPCGAVGIPLDLPLDTRALSFHTSAMKVDFDGEGRSFAGEQVPEEVVWLGVRFRLERRVHANHALTCRGQVITLPNRTGSLHLLAASTNGPATAIVRVGSEAFPVQVGHWTDDTPRCAPAGDIAAYITHRHDADGEDDPYVFCYLHAIDLPVGPGVSEVTFPRLSSVKIFAVTTLESSG